MAKENGDNIILIGVMGAGKTCVGLKLSWKLKKPVEDTDKMIEKKKGCSISEIFRTEGEEAFRQMETQLLQEIKSRKYGRILSVGGGLPVREENRRLLKECGTVVYLRVRPETIYERLKADKSRPLLQCEDPLGRIRALLEERKEAYESCADLILDADEIDVNACADRIAEMVGKMKNRKKPHEQAVTERKRKKLLVINGPNLNFLGIREKAIYGNQDYEYMKSLIAKKADECGCAIEVFQSNHEGAIIDRIQEAYFDGTEGIVINPGAYTHYSYAIHDALASIAGIPKVEIHISDITKREDFRKVSVTAPACDRQIYGYGLDGYLMAIDEVLSRIENRNLRTPSK